MAFARDSMIATTAGTRQMWEIAPGDEVLVYTQSGTVTRRVVFSQGTQPGAQSTMMFIELDSPEMDRLIVDMGQPMLMAGGGIKKAQEIIPGADELLDASGQAVGIRAIQPGVYNRGVHSVATDAPRGATEGHMIIVNGIVCGDFDMEIGE